jgi:hypothetical protein
MIKVFPLGTTLAWALVIVIVAGPKVGEGVGMTVHWIQKSAPVELLPL